MTLGQEGGVKPPPAFLEDAQMKNHMLLKITISVLCIAAAAAIVLRSDETPEYEEVSTSVGSSVIDGFTFAPEELTYDGTDELDLLAGVSLPGCSKQDLKDLVYVHIETAGSISDKRVEYTADLPEGRYQSFRSMHLTGYTGPKITMPQHIPEVKLETTGSFAKMLLSEEDFFVDDGFGNDASAHMEVVAENDMTDSSIIHYTISIENVFGDRDRVVQDVVLTGEYPVIVLEASEIRISAGQTFAPLDYVAKAQKADGTSALNEVVVRGNVNIREPGSYFVSYELEGQKVQMNVIVE